MFVTDRITDAPSDEPRGERGRADSQERILCFDEDSGRPLWQEPYDCAYRFGYPSGPRAMPLVDGSRVYTVGANDHVLVRNDKELIRVDLRSGVHPKRASRTSKH